MVLLFVVVVAAAAPTVVAPNAEGSAELLRFTDDHLVIGSNVAVLAAVVVVVPFVGLVVVRFLFPLPLFDFLALLVGSVVGGAVLVVLVELVEGNLVVVVEVVLVVVVVVVLKSS